MGGKHLKFKKVTKYPHKRSEGLTKRGEARQERLMTGPERRQIELWATGPRFD